MNQLSRLNLVKQAHNLIHETFLFSYFFHIANKMYFVSSYTNFQLLDVGNILILLERVDNLVIASIGSSNASTKGIATRADTTKNEMKFSNAIISVKYCGVLIEKSVNSMINQ